MFASEQNFRALTHPCTRLKLALTFMREAVNQDYGDLLGICTPNALRVYLYCTSVVTHSHIQNDTKRRMIIGVTPWPLNHNLC